MLKPQPPAKPSIELLAQAPTMDNNRLEKLVKNFVVEDKARLAARNKTMPSSIQYALQKFEKNAQLDPNLVKKTATPRPNSYTSATPSPSPSLQVINKPIEYLRNLQMASTKSANIYLKTVFNSINSFCCYKVRFTSTIDN